MTDPIVSVDHLIHHYGTRLAVDDLTFTVQPGEVLALLGPNGAGKTTTVRLLNGLFHPSSGRMSVLGLNPVTQGDLVRKQTGVLTETPALYERLTARQNLEFFGTLAGMPAAQRRERSEELLAFFDLTGRADDRVGAYSKGMKQRLALARTLLHHPPLVFLDEPTSGLDPEGAQQVHELIAAIRRSNGQTVLLATHNLVEAQRLSDRVAVMNHGRLLALGTLEELRQQIAPGLWVQVDFHGDAPQSMVEDLRHATGVLAVEQVSAGRLRLNVQAETVIPALITQLVGQGAQLLAFQPQPVSLEEVYFKLQNAQQAGAQ